MRLYEREVIQNMHSTDVESPPPPLCVYMSIHPEAKSCSDQGRALVLNDTPARGREEQVPGERLQHIMQLRQVPGLPAVREHHAVCLRRGVPVPPRVLRPQATRDGGGGRRQGLTLVNFSAQRNHLVEV